MDMKARVEDILNKLTIDQKCRILSGLDCFRTVGYPEAGLAQIVVTDGPMGVRTMPAEREPNRQTGPATAFPSGSAFASTWDPNLIERVGEVLAKETRALGCDILLGPSVNLIRDPLGGRNFENYSEDPVLAGGIGAGWIRGLQRNGVGASLKHFACNDREWERMRASSWCDERTLHEVHLAMFEYIIRETQPWTVMAAYNRLNGTYMTESVELLERVLRDEWGYTGAVISDWGATHDCLPTVAAGMDLEMPGPGEHRGRRLADSVWNRQISENTVNRCVRRVIELALKCDDGRTEGEANTPEHQALAREVAQRACVLMKNDGNLLPLRKDLKRVAVIGPNANVGLLRGGGSSRVFPTHWVSLLDGVRELVDGKVLYEEGCSNEIDAPILRSGLTRPSDGSAGVDVHYFHNADCSGQAVMQDTADAIEKGFFNPIHKGLPGYPFSLRFNTVFTPDQTGRYRFVLATRDHATIWIDDEQQADVSFDKHGEFLTKQQFYITCEAGKAIAIRAELHHPEDNDTGHIQLMGMFDPKPTDDDRIERAVTLARQADAVILALGNPAHYESEGADRPDLSLPGRQTELAQAVIDANPNTAAVLIVGAPCDLPWLDKLPSLLLAHYPGMHGGHAIARVLFGDAEPTGRLPVTWPKRLEDTPAYLGDDAMNVRYREGIHIGHRWYDTRKIEPLFPFGHGLGYTDIVCTDLEAPRSIAAGNDCTLHATLENQSDRAGRTVVQVYLHSQAGHLPRPEQILAAFQSVEVRAKSSAVVELTVAARQFQVYDPDQHRWTTPKGQYELRIGRSSRTLEQVALIDVH